MAGELKTPNYGIPYYADNNYISNSTTTEQMLTIDTQMKKNETTAEASKAAAEEAAESAASSARQVQAISDDVAILTQSDTKNKEDITNLKQQDAVINNHIVDLQDDITGLQNNETTLANSVNELTQRVQDAENNLSEEVTARENSDTAMNASIAANTSTINSLKDNVETNIEPELSKVQADLLLLSGKSLIQTIQTVQVQGGSSALVVPKPSGISYGLVLIMINNLSNNASRLPVGEYMLDRNLSKFGFGYAHVTTSTINIKAIAYYEKNDSNASFTLYNSNGTAQTWDVETTVNFMTSIMKTPTTME